MNFPDDLCIGDTLLYNKQSIVNDLIDLKTGDDVAHVEGYVGDGMSVASRNGIGVNIYPFRADGLKMVRRLAVPFDKERADQWFNSGIKGQPYNWAALGEFFNLSIDGQGFICSVFWAWYLWHGGVYLFAPEYSLEKISPRDFKLPRQELKTIYYNI